MSEGRNIYVDPVDRKVIRTADVYQIEVEAGTDGYSDTLLSIVANFNNSGIPEGYNARCMVGKSKKGEVALRLYGVVDPDEERFVKVGFKCRGCLAMTACSSVICTMLEGKTFDEALQITGDDLRAAVDGVPWDRAHTLYIAIEGIRALIGDYLMRQGATIEELDERVPCENLSVACMLTEHCSLRDGRVEVQFGLLGNSNQQPSSAAE